MSRKDKSSAIQTALNEPGVDRKPLWLLKLINKQNSQKDVDL
jgi:hypothetical protein